MGQVSIRLLCSKTRVAPIKKITLPRLELCACELAVELTERIAKDLEMQQSPTYFWTDSEIVLSWIHSSPSQYHTFVANRISSIHRASVPEQWRHVSSKNNPADILSRGMEPAKLQQCNIWIYGPIFLYGSEDTWPAKFNSKTECSLERKRKATALIVSPEENRSIIHQINHENSFRKLQRIIGYMLRFAENTKSKTRQPDHKAITPNEMREALYIIIKSMQQEAFAEELKQLQKHGSVEKQSSMSSSAPYLDNRGIIRVGGRLEAASLPFDAKHQMLLPYPHEYTKMLMTDLHKENGHIGPQGLLSITRQHFWPMKGKTVARSITQNCIICFKSKP